MWGLQAPWFMQTGWLKSNRSPRSARKGGIITVRKTLFGSINLSMLQVMKVSRGAKSYQMSTVAKEANDNASRFPLSGQTNNLQLSIQLSVTMTVSMGRANSLAYKKTVMPYKTLKLLYQYFYKQQWIEWACVKGVFWDDKPTDFYQHILQFPSALRSILASLSSLFWF